MRNMRVGALLLLPLLLLLLPAVRGYGQTWDTTGNSQLQGTYYFREVIWLVADGSGRLSRALSIYGNITFDGNGNYTLSGTQIFDTNNGLPQNFPNTTGTYSIGASGFGFLASPVSSGDIVPGLVSRGIFIGSSTGGGYNDLFIAAPLASPTPTSSSFQGNYTLAQIDCPSGQPTDMRNVVMQFAADGNGGIGTIRASGYVGGNGTSLLSQTITGQRYTFSNGAAVLRLGGNITTNLVAGNEYLYFSPDGSFVFGGAPDGWDMIVGVRNPTTSPTFNGLYYQAGMYQDESNLASGYGELYSFYGSLKTSGQTLLNHERVLSVFNNNPLDFTYTNTYSMNADGTYDDAAWHYLFGAGGAIRIGYGRGVSLGINVALQAPAATPSGVYIYPTGIVNAASSALFTAGLAPGELITIYGSNLASATAVDPTFPTKLGGVQVLVNNRPAPVYVVSPGQISAVVPFGTSELTALVKVVNNGVESNAVPAWVNATAPGVFTQPAGGLGYAAALHADYSLVTKDHPAQAGETVLLYVTGLGAVSPAVADGAPGPVSPLSYAASAIGVTIGGKTATTSFIGLAPQLVGLYQINVAIPAGLATGDAAVDVSGPDFYTTQALLPIQ